MRFSKSKLLNTAEFKRSIESEKPNLATYKTALQNSLEQLQQFQNSKAPIAEMVAGFSWVIDQLVSNAWQQHTHQLSNSTKLELVAVGGYGRNELHPYSDVDLLIILDQESTAEIQSSIEGFIQFLWDMGLEIGHSVRSIKDCIAKAKENVTVMTNLLEARHLAGNSNLSALLNDKVRNGNLWFAPRFYNAKFNEQIERHQQYQDTAYSLEPNIKKSPGGLRDLQTILWIYNRRYGVTSYRELLEQGHLLKDEYRLLIRARNEIWKIRFALHLLAGRREDRLLFDSQRALAEQFDYRDTNKQLAVEQLMKRYYRNAQHVLYLNEVLLAHYRATEDQQNNNSQTTSISTNFEIHNQLIRAKNPQLFSNNPEAILKLFSVMLDQQSLDIHPDTIRAVRANLKQINAQFRANPKNRKLFLHLFKSNSRKLSHVLSKMNAYGVLGAYLPIFGNIVGQMQHDLFHVYTVDGHTLKVISFIEKFPDENTDLKIARNIFNTLYKPERLFLAALFHDIAKGQGGDHSELGEVYAKKFCVAHKLSDYDANLVAWLVKNHLIMSHFSQRRDISDPEVIQEFAEIVGDIENLDNLYLLTLADIQGTSPKVWNAWKGQLLLDLYKATSKALRRGVAKPINEAEHVADDKQIALRKLTEKFGESVDHTQVEQFWSTLPNDYFIRYEPYYIAWHVSRLSQFPSLNMPLVAVRYSDRLRAFMCFVYAPDTQQLLPQVTAACDQLGLTIVEAQLHYSTTGFALFGFNALAINIDDKHHKKTDFFDYLEKNIAAHIASIDAPKLIKRRTASRTLKHFPIQPWVNFSQDNPAYTTMEVSAQDQPALIHNVAVILSQHSLKLVGAKISTFGEKAEDVFFIQNSESKPISNKKLLSSVSQQIITALQPS